MVIRRRAFDDGWIYQNRPKGLSPFPANGDSHVTFASLSSKGSSRSGHSQSFHSWLSGKWYKQM